MKLLTRSQNISLVLGHHISISQVMSFLLKVKRAKFVLDKARRWMWKVLVAVINLYFISKWYTCLQSCLIPNVQIPLDISILCPIRIEAL